MQSLVLLALSLAFNSVVGSPMLAVALLLTAGVAHLAAWNLRAAQGAGAGLWWALGTGWVLLVLVVLKYAPAVLSGEGGQSGITAVLLPASTVGVSYWALQSISYLTDVRRGQAEPERNPIALTLSLACFPKVLQGPIERWIHLITQLKRLISFSNENAGRGLVLVAAGLFASSGGVQHDLLSGADESLAQPHATRLIMVFARDWAKGATLRALDFGGGIGARDDAPSQFKRRFTWQSGTFDT